MCSEPVSSLSRVFSTSILFSMYDAFSMEMPWGLVSLLFLTFSFVSWIKEENHQNDKLFDQQTSDDEEFEIPAFLRKQKF